MAVPSPMVFGQGQGVVGADQLNGFVQIVLNIAQLRTLTGVSNMSILMLGSTTPLDGGQALYTWNATSTGPDNGGSVVQPVSGAAGAWLRLAAL